MIEKKLKLANLFDFYGSLLTDKQQDVISLYCFHDLSLGEISENLSVSRQAINDTIRKCEKILSEYESRLNLHEKYVKRKNHLEAIRMMLDDKKNEILDIQSINQINEELTDCME